MGMDTTTESPLAGFAGGTEWCVDASGCAPALLRDLDLIGSICDSVVRDLGLTVVGEPQRHAFPGPGGVTVLYLLSESHLACHTYPEYSFATFNLYCCRNRTPWDWRERLVERLKAGEVVVREIHRQIHRHAELDRLSGPRRGTGERGMATETSGAIVGRTLETQG